MKSNSPLFLIPFLLACTAEKIEDTATASPFAPTAGSWSFDSTSYSTDDCNLANNSTTSPAIIDALVFTLDNVSETEVTLTNATGIAYDCTLDGMTLTCNTSSEEELESYSDLDGNEVTDANGNLVDPVATTKTTLTSTATFSDSETATYTATLTAECTGTDCDDVLAKLEINQTPCTSTYSGNFLLQD